MNTGIVAQNPSQHHPGSDQDHQGSLPASQQGGTGPLHKVVSNGIDTFDIRIWCCSLPSSWYYSSSATWKIIKENWDENEITYSVQFPDGTWWNLFKSGKKPYSHQLYNPEIGFIKIWNDQSWDTGYINKQQIQLKLFSSYIHTLTASQLKDEWKRISSFFYEDSHEIQAAICRGDLYVDVQVDRVFTYDEYMNVFTRSKRNWCEFEYDEVMFNENEEKFLNQMSSSPPSYNRGSGNFIDLQFDNEFWSKVNKMYRNQVTMGSNRIFSKRNEVETSYYGVSKNSKVWSKIYNKTKEVQNKKDDTFPSIWLKNGWDGKSTVLRVEFTMKGSFLNEMVSTTYYPVDDFIDNVGDIWAYFTHKWMRMVEERNINNTPHSFVTPFWKLVQSAFVKPVNNIVRKRSYKGTISMLETQGLGCLRKAISCSMLFDTDINLLKMKFGDYFNNIMDDYSSGRILSQRRSLGLSCSS